MDSIHRGPPEYVPPDEKGQAAVPEASSFMCHRDNADEVRILLVGAVRRQKSSSGEKN
jgi:hypothetical protein